MFIRRLVGTTCLAGALLAGAQANAQTPACNDATMIPNPIYISGSSALEPMLKVIGPKIAAQAAPNNYTIVYLTKGGSCGGVKRAFTDGKITQNMQYLPIGYDPNVTAVAPTCTVDAATGVVGDLVLSDVDYNLCPPPVPAKPATQADFQGPVNTMGFVVPKTSNQKSITREEAYLMLGKGMAGGIAPWTNPAYIFQRANDSGTRALISANIDIGFNNWLGTQNDTGMTATYSTQDVFTKVSASNMLTQDIAEQTIGIMSEDFYDSSTQTSSNRDAVHWLAFRAKDQKHAYWPDSTLTARDKRNVRDGHYTMWGYIHMVAEVASGAPTVPVNAKARYIIDLLQGKLNPAPPTFDVVDAIIQSHLTPTCAMTVTHAIEGGPLSKITPADACGCSFEKAATNAVPASCVACDATTPCTGGKTCRRGYCE